MIYGTRERVPYGCPISKHCLRICFVRSLAVIVSVERPTEVEQACKAASDRWTSEEEVSLYIFLFHVLIPVHYIESQVTGGKLQKLVA